LNKSASNEMAVLNPTYTKERICYMYSNLAMNAMLPSASLCQHR